MSVIIATDLSLNSSGICVMDLAKGSPIHYESITSDMDNIERLNYNYNRYLNILTSYKDVSCIVFEAQNPNMRYSYHAGSLISLAENVGVWKLAIYHSLPSYNIPPIILSVPAQDIKKFATSNGGATKEEMIEAVNGNHIKSIRRSIPEHSVNDVADAYHLARMTRDLLLKDQDYSKYILKDYRSLLGGNYDSTANDNNVEVTT